MMERRKKGRVDGEKEEKGRIMERRKKREG